MTLPIYMVLMKFPENFQSNKPAGAEMILCWLMHRMAAAPTIAIFLHQQTEAVAECRCTYGVEVRRRMEM